MQSVYIGLSIEGKDLFKYATYWLKRFPEINGVEEIKFSEIHSIKLFES